MAAFFLLPSRSCAGAAIAPSRPQDWQCGAEQLGVDPFGAHTLQCFTVVLRHGFELGFSQERLAGSGINIIMKIKNPSFEVLGAFNGMFAEVG